MKLRNILLAVAFGLAVQVNAMSATPLGDSVQINQNENIENNDSETNSPQFPGGDDALKLFISRNLSYPPEACGQGRVFVQVLVKEDGSIGDVKVVRGLGVDFDNEAIRVCKMLPQFIPGKQNGKPIEAWRTVVVTFKIVN